MVPDSAGKTTRAGEKNWKSLDSQLFNTQTSELADTHTHSENIQTVSIYCKSCKLYVYYMTLFGKWLNK